MPLFFVKILFRLYEKAAWPACRDPGLGCRDLGKLAGLKKFHPAWFAGMKNIQIHMPFLKMQPGHRLIFLFLGIKWHFTVTRANLSIYFESKHNTLLFSLL